MHGRLVVSVAFNAEVDSAPATAPTEAVIKFRREDMRDAFGVNVHGALPQLTSLRFPVSNEKSRTHLSYAESQIERGTSYEANIEWQKSGSGNSRFLHYAVWDGTGHAVE